MKNPILFWEALQNYQLPKYMNISSAPENNSAQKPHAIMF